MRRFIHNFCEGIYDSLPYNKKKEFTVQQLEETFAGVLIPLFRKIILILICMVLSIYASFVFKIPNKKGLLVTEFIFWCYWIYQTINWKDFKQLIKDLQR